MLEHLWNEHLKLAVALRLRLVDLGQAGASGNFDRAQAGKPGETTQMGLLLFARRADGLRAT